MQQKAQLFKRKSNPSRCAHSLSPSAFDAHRENYRRKKEQELKKEEKRARIKCPCELLMNN